MHDLTYLRIAPVLLALSACVEVKIIDDDDRPQGSGGDPGASTTSIAAGASGAGGDGGSDPDPVVGCEALEVAGDPIFIAGDLYAQFPQLAPIDAERVGLVYVDREGPEDILNSRILGGPFTIGHRTWARPSSISARDPSSTPSASCAPVPTASSALRPETILTSLEHSGSPAPSLWNEAVILEPFAGGGAFGIVADGGLELIHCSTLSASAPPVSVWEGFAECARALDGFIAPDQLLLAVRSFRSCETPGPISFVHISDGVATTGATWPQEIVPSDPTAILRILPRPGGAWVAATTYEGATVQAVDALGSPIGAAFDFRGRHPRQQRTCGRLPRWRLRPPPAKRGRRERRHRSRRRLQW